MVLLAIKRLSEVPLAQTEEQYRGSSLGSKLNGIRPCPSVGKKCRNMPGKVGLRELAKGDSALLSICDEIQELTAKRNRLMHGLVTTVADSSVVFHSKKLYDLPESEVLEMSERVMYVIERLNELVPVPGLTATMASGPSIDIDYTIVALDPSDPIVKVADKASF